MTQRHTSSSPHPNQPALQTTLTIVLVATMAACWPLLFATPASAHMKGMFKTQRQAEQRAAELKCKGAFAMGSLWMPCANEQMLHKALQNE
jgi:hypothetical protein